eukprot:3440562-Rhodomonas_salina.2
MSLFQPSSCPTRRLLTECAASRRAEPDSQGQPAGRQRRGGRRQDWRRRCARPFMEAVLTCMEAMRALMEASAGVGGVHLQPGNKGGRATDANAMRKAMRTAFRVPTP